MDRLLTEYIIFYLDNNIIKTQQGFNASITKTERGNNRKQTSNVLQVHAQIATLVLNLMERQEAFTAANSSSKWSSTSQTSEVHGLT